MIRLARLLEGVVSHACAEIAVISVFGWWSTLCNNEAVFVQKQAVAGVDRKTALCLRRELRSDPAFVKPTNANSRKSWRRRVFERLLSVQEKSVDYEVAFACGGFWPPKKKQKKDDFLPCNPLSEALFIRGLDVLVSQ